MKIGMTLITFGALLAITGALIDLYSLRHQAPPVIPRLAPAPPLEDMDEREMIYADGIIVGQSMIMCQLATKDLQPFYCQLAREYIKKNDRKKLGLGLQSLDEYRHPSK